jgi:hypothetical protein
MRKKNCLSILVILWVMAILLPGYAFAQGKEKGKPAPDPITPTPGGKTDEAVANLEQRLNKIEEKIKADEATFWTNWGVGLIANVSSGQKRPIKSARIDSNTIVRVEHEDYFAASLGLEVHKFLYGGDLWKGWGTFCSEFAVGPYISVVPGSNNLISSIGGASFLAWKEGTFFFILLSGGAAL